jgi:hypothetical protein
LSAYALEPFLPKTLTLPLVDREIVASSLERFDRTAPCPKAHFGLPLSKHVSAQDHHKVSGSSSVMAFINQ